MSETDSVERKWPSRLGVALAAMLCFYAAQYLPVEFRNPEMNRRFYSFAMALSFASIALSLVSAKRLKMVGRVFAGLVVLLSLYFVYLAIAQLAAI